MFTRSGSFTEDMSYFGNGNVSSQAIFNRGLNLQRSLSYTYDDMNRLTHVNNGSVE